MAIGKIEKVPLREIWKHEAKDFTTWLYDNIEFLSDELDLTLSPVEKEQDCGSFSADIIAEDPSGFKVVIENQLEKTDHDHLGKLLTYVSNLEAKIAIWISSEPRPEHETAINWLNENGPDVNFYLVQIEAYKIGNSDPAPKFTIVAGPSEKSIIVGKEKKELAERHKKMFSFWTSFLERSKPKTSLHSGISPSKYHWIGTGSGKRGLGYNYAITDKGGQAELYIDRGDKEENKKIYDTLFGHKKEIEKSFGETLDWQRLDGRRACRIRRFYNYAGLNDENKWEKLQNDMIDGMIRLERSTKNYIKELAI